jgi:hypothetical protein
MTLVANMREDFFNGSKIEEKRSKRERMEEFSLTKRMNNNLHMIYFV